MTEMVFINVSLFSFGGMGGKGEKFLVNRI